MTNPIKLTAKHFASVTRRDRCNFPLYSKPILNIATQNSKATQPRYVGSMKEYWIEFMKTGGRSVDEWEHWYMSNDGEAKIDAGTEKLYNMLNRMPLDHSVFTREIARNYILDLVINKTHYGMSGEYYSVIAVAKYFDMPHRFSTAEEESQGIDAWIGDCPVQVKPEDSVTKHHVRNHADTEKTLVVTYKAKSDACIIHNPDFIKQ